MTWNLFPLLDHRLRKRVQSSMESFWTLLNLPSFHIVNFFQKYHRNFIQSNSYYETTSSCKLAKFENYKGPKNLQPDWRILRSYSCKYYYSARAAVLGWKSVGELTKGLGAADRSMVSIIHLSLGSTKPTVHTIQGDPPRD